MKKVLKATIRETDDEFHIECRFFDGQKFSAAIIDKVVPEAQDLAIMICDCLQCKIQQMFQRSEIIGIIEKPYGEHLECEFCIVNCSYKQFKCKEQKCEKFKNLHKINNEVVCKLKSQLQAEQQKVKELNEKELKQANDNIEDKNTQLILELEKIKSILENHTAQTRFSFDQVTGQSIYLIDKIIEKQRNRDNKYKQALEKIEDKVKNKTSNDCSIDSFILDDFCQELMEIINEVKDER